MKVFFKFLLGSSPLRGRILSGSFFFALRGEHFYFSCLLVDPIIGYSFFHRNGLFYGFPLGFFGLPGGF